MAALDLPLGEEQRMLQESVQRFLADHARPGWRDLSGALGLAGIALPENAGGFGGGAIDIALVMAELGPALAGADWLSHVAASALLARVAPEHPALGDLAAGRRRIAIICAASAAAMPAVDGGLVRGSAALVAGAAEADLLLIASDAALLLVAADGDKVEQRHRIMHDGSVSADLAFMLKPGDGALLADGEEARALADHANDLILAARCAEAVGLMQRMIADSVDYLGQRRQFGTPIGGFQSLRHRAADMQLAVMKASALTELAVVAVDQGRPDRAQAVSAACIEVGDAVRIVGESAVQIHGAMGLTEELSLGGHFKRALAIAAAFGPRAGHLARFAETAN
ncbi:Acyl-CoA dehydrogenase domain protein [uncultured Sphingopyxis sp.]|uniref:Acyl-CoA dehydrogenase domain protein n=1 Tax=uncultured Sphingopyxis sp. TaxID=310581 RepID=A0A1Y5PU57_9SPHN|nr:acyl-CoA dehydrogenase family protein [uncultured Sphingopyxis sp.]SBV33529.1 Acyl-CoA dehydrogenase domain protein [uncultured Sphingopyxis sp.]